MFRSLATTLAASPVVRGASVLLAATALVGGWLVVRPDCMVIERVVFEGHHRAGASALRHLADIPNGTTIWAVDLDRAARGAERHPWVRSARAIRQWPDTVILEVQEYEPVALLHYDGLYYVDADGTPFLGDVADDLDYPSITGIGPGLERAHPDLPRLAVRDALWLIEELDTRGLVPRDAISEVNFSRARGFTVHADRSRLVFAVDDLERQVSRLSLLLERGQVDLGTPSWVDLAPATVAIVRPLTDLPSRAGNKPFSHL